MSAMGSLPSTARTTDRTRDVEAILPLLPNQKALLLVAARSGDADPGFLQVRVSLEGPLDSRALEAAWQTTMAAHQGLRSTVNQRKGADPLLVVWREATVDMREIDVRDMDADEQRDRIDAFLEEDRTTGLDLSVVPPMRVAVFALSDTRHELVWTCHHLLSDGWSAAVVLEDVLAHYRSLVGGVEPPREPSRNGLRDYVAWATAPDDGSTESFWRGRLSGFEGAPPLLLGAGPESDGETASATAIVPPETVDRVLEASTDLRVTPNTLVQAAWALVLARLLSTTDVVFGTSVAGRSVPVHGVERTVGYLSNAVPVRTTIDASASVADWLTRLRDDQFAMQPHEHASLGDVLGWSEVAGGRVLFDSFLVFENLPRQGGGPAPGELSMSSFRSGVTAAFPLTIAVTLGNQWIIHARFDDRRCSPSAMASVLDGLVEALGAIAQHPNSPIGEIRIDDADRLAGLLTSPRPATQGRASYRPPSGPAQEALARMWADLLGLDAVGIDDDFFALGGTSLGAVRLFARIEEEFDASLPLSTLITRPTIAALSEALQGDGGGGEGHTCIVPIQPEGDRVPIICVHGGGGEILYYRPLADRLGPDQPVYGLEPVGLDGASEPLDTVPEMAARYVSDLRDVQPHGPYRLVGYCFGGSVALEMAAQLEEAGEQVQMVAVIDGGLPLDAARASTTLARARALLRTRGFVGTGKAVVARARNRGQIWWDGSFGGTEGRERAKYSGVAQACSRAFSTFEPRPTRAPVTLIRSTESRVAEGKDWHTRWDEYTTEFHLEWIDAPHLDLFKTPAVEDLAATIEHMMGDSP